MTSKGPRPYVFVAGSGRSGTTWLAEILASHPGTSYRHEPFEPGKAPPYREWLDGLGDHAGPDAALDLEPVLRRMFHRVDRPPFGRPAHRRVSGAALRLLHEAAFRSSAAARLFNSVGRQRLDEDTTIVMKDVAIRADLVPRVVHALDAQLVTIVRSPYGAVASALKGREQGVFGDDRAERIRRIRSVAESGALDLEPALLESLDEASEAKLAALRWRAESEPTYRFARTYHAGHVVVYRELCDDPEGQTRKLFDALDWQLTDATAAYLATSTSGGADGRFYGTTRDPKAVVDKWRSQLDDQQIEDIRAATETSPLMELWPDIIIDAD